MALLLTDTQKVPLAILPVDAHGHAAKIDGLPIWAVSDPAVGSIENVTPDGLGCEFFSLDPGVCQVSVTADADIGTGVRTITSTLDIQVEPGEAVGFAITAGLPVQQ